MKIQLSKELRYILTQLESRSMIANMLLNGNTSDINYLDISHKEPDKISYITKDRICKIQKSYKAFDTTELYDSLVWKKQRYYTKPGKIVRKIFDGVDISDKDIDIFSSSYRGLIEKDNVKLSVIKGGYIKKYFHYIYYEKQSGTIGQSCMRYDHSQDLLDFYSINKNISMLVIFSKKVPTTIVGRSLLWETEEGYKIMDRIYTVDDRYNYLFIDWAKKNEYHIKKKNNWYNTRNFITPNDEHKELKLSCKLDSVDTLYPYLDTFKWLDTKNKIIYNYLPNNNKNIKVLLKLDGSWCNWNTLLFDGLYRYYRRKEEVVFCKYLNIHTISNITIESEMNHDFILKSDCINDKDFGIIFNKKYNKHNNKKKMMKIILDKVIKIHDNGDINETKFNNLKIKFEKIEREREKEMDIDI